MNTEISFPIGSTSISWTLEYVFKKLSTFVKKDNTLRLLLKQYRELAVEKDMLVMNKNYEHAAGIQDKEAVLLESFANRFNVLFKSDLNREQFALFFKRIAHLLPSTP